MIEWAAGQEGNVTRPFQPFLHHWLDYENIHKADKKRNPVVTMASTGWPGLCICLFPVVPQLPADLRQYHNTDRHFVSTSTRPRLWESIKTVLNQSPPMETHRKKLIHLLDLSSIGTCENVKVGIGKARETFMQVKNIWSSTKIRFFNSNVKYLLIYGAETQRGSKTTFTKVITIYQLLPEKNPSDSLIRSDQ